MTVEGKETLPVHCESCARLALPDTFKTSATSPKSANWTSVLILFSPPPQQTPLGGSTEPRNATKPSKIRDVNFTVTRALDRGAGRFLFDLIDGSERWGGAGAAALAAALELGGWLRQQADRNSTARAEGLRRALSPTFRAGAMVFFIPWRVVAEESGAAHYGFGGAMLLDLPGPALRLLTDVADFHFSDIAVRGDDGARAIGATDDAAAVELRGRRRQHP